MSRIWSLFEVYGIEIEYMIVDRESFSVRPMADTLLRDEHGRVTDELANGPISWCNELVSHVLELKCTEPARDLTTLANHFHSNIDLINRKLAEHGACLMPGGMHPWMNPDRETQLWPYGQKEVYQRFDQIFSCRGHGWSNLQSMQINLPFANDREFAALHAAIRLVLPLISGLAASTPYADGRDSGALSHRMQVYGSNSRRIPLVTGEIVPETINSMEDYQQRILQPMYKAIAPMDPDGILQHEWLNARGSIARFDRMAIEIRTIDSQECANADLAIAEVISETVRNLVEQRHSTLAQQQAPSTSQLAALMQESFKHAEVCRADQRQFLSLFGLNSSSASLAEIWGHQADLLSAEGRLSRRAEQCIEHILRQGTLATRMRRLANASQANARSLTALAEVLCKQLADNRQLDA